MEFDGLTRACASRAEFRSVRRGKAVLVGMGCFNDPHPEGELLSCGVTGSLVPELKLYGAVEGTRIVDINGNELWSRDPAAKPTGLPEVSVYATDRIVDEPDERQWLHKRTGAHVLDMESGILARTGRLKRIVRVVSDNPSFLLRMAAFMLLPNGRTDKLALGWALKMDPVGTLPELLQLWKALRSFKNLGL